MKLNALARITLAVAAAAPLAATPLADPAAGVDALVIATGQGGSTRILEVVGAPGAAFAVLAGPGEDSPEIVLMAGVLDEEGRFREELEFSSRFQRDVSGATLYVVSRTRDACGPMRNVQRVRLGSVDDNAVFLMRDTELSVQSDARNAYWVESSRGGIIFCPAARGVAREAVRPSSPPMLIEPAQPNEAFASGFDFVVRGPVQATLSPGLVTLHTTEEHVVTAENDKMPFFGLSIDSDGIRMHHVVVSDQGLSAGDETGVVLQAQCDELATGELPGFDYDLGSGWELHTTGGNLASVFHGGALRPTEPEGREARDDAGRGTTIYCPAGRPWADFDETVYYVSIQLEEFMTGFPSDPRTMGVAGDDWIIASTAARSTAPPEPPMISLWSANDTALLATEGRESERSGWIIVCPAAREDSVRLPRVQEESAPSPGQPTHSWSFPRGADGGSPEIWLMSTAAREDGSWTPASHPGAPHGDILTAGGAEPADASFGQRYGYVYKWKDAPTSLSRPALEEGKPRDEVLADPLAGLPAASWSMTTTEDSFVLSAPHPDPASVGWAVVPSESWSSDGEVAWYGAVGDEREADDDRPWVIICPAARPEGERDDARSQDSADMRPVAKLFQRIDRSQIGEYHDVVAILPPSEPEAVEAQLQQVESEVEEGGRRYRSATIYCPASRDDGGVDSPTAYLPESDRELATTVGGSVIIDFVAIQDVPERP